MRAALLLRCAGLLLPAAAPAWGAAFTDVTSGTLGHNQYGVGVSWSDVDVDGDPDLFLLNDGSVNLLYRNDGASFPDMAAPPLDNPGATYAATWADYDGDGDPDVYISADREPNQLLRNDAGVFTDVTTPELADSAGVTGQNVAWIDYDNDGDLDLNVGRATYGNKLFRNDGGAFVDVVSPVAGNSYAARGTWGDFDGDGDLDLFEAVFGTVSDRLFRNDGGGAFVRVEKAPMNTTVYGAGGVWMDMDNDLDLDLFLATPAGKANRLYRNDGNENFVLVTSGPLLTFQTVGCATAVDYDNDADLDLFLCLPGIPEVPTPNELLRNDGDGVFVVDPTPALDGWGETYSAAWADIDGDGDLDAYLAEVSWMPNQLVRNDLANGNHWLMVDVEGTASNRPGIGARVVVTAGGVSQLREVQAQGYNGQSDRIVHFGLGAAAVVDTLRITWPSGMVDVLTAVAADQTVFVLEGSTGPTEAPVSAQGPAMALRVAPNPFRAAVTMSVELHRAGSVSVGVYDLSGRRIRQIHAGSRGAGVHRFVWDGNDARGSRVAPGVYFVRLRGPEGAVSAPVVRIR